MLNSYDELLCVQSEQQSLIYESSQYVHCACNRIHTRGDASKAGILFGANYAASPGAGQNLVLQVSNPGGSGKTMYVSRISGSVTTAGTTFSILKNGTIAGTAVTPVNFNFASAGTSAMTARSLLGTVSGSPVTVLAFLLAAGQFNVDFTGSIVVPAGTSLTVTIGTGSTTASANPVWWEY